LFFTPEAPFPAIGGGALRAASLLHYLAARYCLDMIAFREAGSANPASAAPPGMFERALVLDLAPHSRRGAARLARNAVRIARGVPPLVDRFAGFDQAVARFVSSRRYKVAIVEHLWCAPYSEQLAPHSDKLVLDAHNVESDLMAGYAAIRTWPVSALFKRFERASLSVEERWLPRFTLTLAASEEDRALLARIAPDAKIHVYPNSLPPTARASAAEENTIVFSGNMEYPPNSDAVRYFHERIWPLVHKSNPDVVWRILGNHAETVAGHVARDPNIQVCGRMGDAVTELARSRLVIVPLRAGSGTRFKILEAWAAARPVVSTTLGAAGLGAIDGRHLLMADEPESFAGAVSSLLGSARLRASLGEAGRRLYEDNFTWESAWRRLGQAGL
jgi:glycosyltransferase involved in cell wall biosynthesis